MKEEKAKPTKRVKATQNKAKETETKPVSLSLSIKERLGFPQLLPRQGDILSQTLAQDIRNKTQIKQSEIKKVGLRTTETGQVTWDVKTSTKITFTNAEMTFLKAQVNKLDKEKKVTPDTLSLCLKIYN